MTLANGLTLLRGLMLVPMVWAVLAGRLPLAFALLVVAALTDVLDGLAARSRHEVTELGKWLDPVMDKVFYMGLLAVLAYVGRIPWLAFALFVAPQAGIAIGAAVFWGQRRHFGARWPGKLAASLTALATALVLLADWGVWLLWGAIATQFIAGAYYLWVRARDRKPPEEEPPARGAPPYEGG
ncbi:MAG: CDP-alcohol phosphatidyltransferase family protein [Candidatus Bipolaricaulota bacterium]